MIYLELLKDIPVTTQGYMKTGTIKTQDEWCNIIGRKPGSIVYDNKLSGSDKRWWKIVNPEPLYTEEQMLQAIKLGRMAMKDNKDLIRNSYLNSNTKEEAEIDIIKKLFELIKIK